ncbi:MAG: fibronectin type III domain-containing protein [Clostridiales bacterium]|nr:fibronectin type III domain-containing protein [Clostridiales bacterium]
MKRNAGMKRVAAFILVFMFAFVSVFAVSPSTAFAAAKRPAKVKGVKAVAKSSSSIKITWKKTKNAKKYLVFRATRKNGKYKKVKTTTKRSFVNKSLKAEKKYFYKVRAINGKKKGAFSSKVSAKTKKKTALEQVEVNTAAKTVTISAKVNGTYFKESTRHLMVDRDGFNAGKAILTSYCSPVDLYNGLVKAGGVSWSKSADKTLKMASGSKKGEKISEANAENKNYSSMDVMISWADKSYGLSEVLTTEKGGSKAPKINMVFSGNPGAAKKTPSGCMVCLDSCYIGIVSNDKYGCCDIDEGNPTVFARKDILPADGTVVKVTFTLK